MAQSLKDLEVWRRARRLAVMMDEPLESSRDYALNDPMQRSVVSVASDIAESYERTPKDFIHFLVMNDSVAGQMIDECKQIGRMLQSLINDRQANAVIRETSETYSLSS